MNSNDFYLFIKVLSVLNLDGTREIGVGGDNQNGPKTLDVPISFFDTTPDLSS